MGVLEFEALHSLFRIKWRDIDDALKINYMPKRPLLLSNGFIFLSNNSEEWTRLYSFKNPSNCDEWKDFNLELIEQKKFKSEYILDFISTLKQNNSECVVLNSSLEKSFDSIEAVDFVMKCKIYYMLLKDYMF